jgi:magnesium transporter
MARFIKSRKKSHGTVPGSLIFIGNPKMEKTEIHLMIFNKEQLSETVVYHADEIPDSVPVGSVMWVNVYGLHDTELIGNLGERFAIQSS